MHPDQVDLSVVDSFFASFTRVGSMIMPGFCNRLPDIILACMVDRSPDALIEHIETGQSLDSRKNGDNKPLNLLVCLQPPRVSALPLSAPSAR